MLAFLIALSVMVLLIVLPLTTSMRLLRISREMEELRERIAALERALRAGAGAGAGASAGSRSSAPESGSAAVEVPPLLGAAQPAFSGEDPGPAPGAAAMAAPSAAAVPAPDLEERIGGRGLLYTGVLVLLLGVSFFLKYAFDNAWIDETGRVVSGGAAGGALIASGWRLAARDLRTFGHALIGTGLAVLYLSIYAALNFYALVSAASAFALMAAITIASAVLADRRRSQPLAFIAVGGGFLTPFLVGGSDDAQLTLFSYDALLIAGTLVLARRHDWFLLNAASYLLTVFTVFVWAVTQYSDATWLRTLLFLTLFCVMFVQILRDTRRSTAAAARVVAGLLTTAPVLYHVVAVVLTARHPPAVHIYVIAFSVVGLWLTADPHRPGWRLLLLLASYAPLFGTVTLPAGLSWMAANVVTIVAVAALHLLAPLDRVFRQDEHLETSELAALHVAGIGLFGLLYQALQPSYPEWRGVLAALLAAAAFGLWQLLKPREPDAAINALAIAFTLAALAVAVQFDGRAVVVGWAAEGAGAVWVGMRAGSAAFQTGGLVLWGLAVARLFDGYFVTPAGFTLIFNARALTTAFVVALAYVMGVLYARYRDRFVDAGRTRAMLHIVAAGITLAGITAEVGSYWEIRYLTPQAYLYEQLVLSLAWAIYGAILIVSGMRRAYPPDRYLGIAVLVMTVLKVFFVDLWQLGGIYRVVAFIVFGVLLVAVSYLYQRRMTPARRPAGGDTAPIPEPGAQSDHPA